jgi:hypothetical protein
MATSFGSTRGYLRDGPGTPAVLLHGAGATSATWADVVPAIDRPVSRAQDPREVVARARLLPDVETEVLSGGHALSREATARITEFL